MGVLVRLLLLCMIALTVVSGGSIVTDIASDQPIELVELEGTEAILVHPVELPPQALSGSIPAVLQGTEEEHPSPELARVFRPPRVAFV